MGEYCLYYTRWEDIPEQIKVAITNMFGGNLKKSEEFYKNYFYWFNIVHEMGHILRKKYGTTSTDAWEEEESVNDFAVSFWRYNKQDKRLKSLMQDIEDILSIIPNPVPSECDKRAYFNKKYNEFDPMTYGYFQFSFVLNSLRKNEEFYEVIKNRIYPDAVFIEHNYFIDYAQIDEKLPQMIINNLRKYLQLYEIELPQVTAINQFTPNIQYVSYK